MALRILHTNDLHGKLTPDIVGPLQIARDSADFYFDSGDCIKTGNLGLPLSQEPVWALLHKLNCTASTIGNRETHVLEGAFQAKIAGSSHPVLCANMRRRDGTLPLGRSLTLESAGLKIGVFGVSVPMVTEKMASKVASAFLWDQPSEIAKNLCHELRPTVDLLIALTHIGYPKDVALAQSCPEIDIILGGHSHTVIQEPVREGKTWICQGGSHARFFGLYEWDDGTLTGGLVPWLA